jgi:hypothetical protein
MFAKLAGMLPVFLQVHDRSTWIRSSFSIGPVHIESTPEDSVSNNASIMTIYRIR